MPPELVDIFDCRVDRKVSFPIDKILDLGLGQRGCEWGKYGGRDRRSCQIAREEHTYIDQGVKFIEIERRRAIMPEYLNASVYAGTQCWTLTCVDERQRNIIDRANSSRSVNPDLNQSALVDFKIVSQIPPLVVGNYSIANTSYDSDSLKPHFPLCSGWLALLVGIVALRWSFPDRMEHSRIASIVFLSSIACIGYGFLVVLPWSIS